MRKIACHIAAAILLLAVAGASLADTVIEERIRARIEAAYLTDSLEVMDERMHARRVLQRAYTERAFRPYWVTSEGLGASGRNFALWLDSEPRRHGLRPEDYHLEAVDALEDAERNGALVDLELALSDAFLMIGSHFLAGRLNPETLDPEWFASRRHMDLAPVLERAAGLEQPGEALTALLPTGRGYAALVERLGFLRQIRDSGGWNAVSDGPTLREGDTGPRVAELARRLSASGDYNGETGEVFGPELSQAVMRFQSRHGLNPDGAVGRATLRVLNVPVDARIDQIVVNLERWRWLPETLGDRYITVNIAGFNLDVVEQGETKLSMRVVVGQPYRRTPVFSGTMTYLVLNPSWEVPPSIAVKDKLPAIRKDPAYLERQGYTLLKGWGADEKIVDPGSIDWQSLSAREFGFRLRQSPGPYNALGQVKFMFPNQHAVYLHDTPSRDLFAKETRSFSSGCIRLQQPLELAELLLGGNPRWSRGEIDRVVASGEQKVVTLERPIPVHLLYWTAWIGDDGTMQFRDDIYGRDARVLTVLSEAPPPAGADPA